MSEVYGSSTTVFTRFQVFDHLPKFHQLVAFSDHEIVANESKRRRNEDVDEDIDISEEVDLTFLHLFFFKLSSLLGQPTAVNIW